MPVTWRRQESVSFAVYRAVARDLSRIIERLSSLQIPRRVLRNEFIEVHRNFVLPDEGAEVEIRVYRKTNHLASIVNGVTAGGDRHDGPGERAEVMYSCLLGPQEGVKGAVLRLRIPDHFTSVIDASSNVAGGASQVAEINGRAVFFPEHGVRRIRLSKRQNDIRAQTRRADGLGRDR
jgi:hypothetical protein